MNAFKSFEFAAGIVLIALIGGAVLLSPLLFPDGGTAQSLVDRLTPPFQTWEYPLGTDPLGRDILARVVVGGRVSAHPHTNHTPMHTRQHSHMDSRLTNLLEFAEQTPRPRCWPAPHPGA